MQFIGNKINQKWQKVRTRGHNLGCVNMIAKSLKDDEGEMGEVSKGRGAFRAEGGAQIDN